MKIKTMSFRRRGNGPLTIIKEITYKTRPPKLVIYTVERRLTKSTYQNWVNNKLEVNKRENTNTDRK